jgi:hypothetical protein
VEEVKGEHEQGIFEVEVWDTKCFEKRRDRNIMAPQGT